MTSRKELHETEVLPVELERGGYKTLEYQARCSCGWVARHRAKNKGEAENEAADHILAIVL